MSTLSPSRKHPANLRNPLPQYPQLIPTGINFTAIERDLVARDQVTPVLFQLKTLVRALEDTHMALGIDLFNGTRGMYKAVKLIAEINGVQDIIAQIGERFARARKSTTPATPESTEPSAM